MTPQGVIAVCQMIDVPLDEALAGNPRLVVLCDQVRDPGNVGTVIRCADAFGADAVLISRDSVDVYNAKAVRATTGSLFHLPLAVEVDLSEAVTLARDYRSPRLRRRHSGGLRDRRSCSIRRAGATDHVGAGKRGMGTSARAREQIGPAGCAAALRTRREPQSLDCCCSFLVRLRHGPTRPRVQSLNAVAVFDHHS